MASVRRAGRVMVEVDHMTAIPFLRVSGTHREVGRQVGAATAETVRRAVAVPFDPVLVEPYRARTAEHLPWILDELEGVAEGAGVDPFAVFAGSVVELASGGPLERCTDLVAMSQVTAGGHLLVAHNNDYTANSEPDYVAIEWCVPGEPVCFTLGLGPWLAVGWNDAGLSVTANELAPSDERVGIPRALQMRDVVTRRTLDDALEAVLHPARASSYNWVLAHRDGRAIDVEGGACCAEVIEPECGVLAHTNHYIHPRMLDLEKSTGVVGSTMRLGRARELLAARGRPWTVDALVAVLSDHANAPDSVCRHGVGEDARTVFWCVADVTAGSVRYGSGPPCISEPISYCLSP
jgi:isopenicillin-N N-acyltransferase-like protein